MKHYITDEDINRVSIKNLPYHDDNTCEGIEAYCKYLLSASKEYNNSNECGLVLDSFDFTKFNIFKGTDTNVKLTIDFNQYLQRYPDEHANRYIFIHNHPNCRGFSIRDFKSFINNDALYLLIALQNDGLAHILIKSELLTVKPELKVTMTHKEVINYLKGFGILYFRRYSNV